VTCRDVIGFLRDYLDGELPADQRAEFERHLGLCPPCRHYLDSYRATVALGAGAFRDGAGDPPELPPELVAAVLAARRRPPA
jgi:anti-sigma factor RsiW